MSSPGMWAFLLHVQEDGIYHIETLVVRYTLDKLFFKVRARLNLYLSMLTLVIFLHCLLFSWPQRRTPNTDTSLYISEFLKGFIHTDKIDLN